MALGSPRRSLQETRGVPRHAPTYMRRTHDTPNSRCQRRPVSPGVAAVKHARSSLRAACWASHEVPERWARGVTIARCPTVREEVSKHSQSRHVSPSRTSTQAQSLSRQARRAGRVSRVFLACLPFLGKHRCGLRQLLRQATGEASYRSTYEPIADGAGYWGRKQRRLLCARSGPADGSAPASAVS